MISIKNVLSPNERVKVKEFLEKIKPYLKAHEYEIKVNSKNKEFDRVFNLRDQEKQDILTSLTVDDCVRIANNDNSNYEDSEIYIFLKKTTLFVYGEIDEIELYIKMYLQDCGYYDTIIVISFHKSGEFE